MTLKCVRLELRPILDEDKNEIKDDKEKFFLIFMSKKKRFTLYALNEEEYKTWIQNLKKVCILTNYSDTYINIKMIGKGSFAKVKKKKRRSKIKQKTKFEIKKFFFFFSLQPISLFICYTLKLIHISFEYYFFYLFFLRKKKFKILYIIYYISLIINIKPIIFLYYDKVF